MEDLCIKVLDHGFVRLVDWLGSDLSIVRAARVSYDDEPRGDGSDEKLIRYLLRNHHTSPFEHVVMTFDVKAPLFVFRQWHRHRTWSYNEISARYSVLPEEFFVPAEDTITTQSDDNKQMRTDQQHDKALTMRKLMRMAGNSSFTVYNRLIAEGVPRELARTVLPVSTYSHMFATVDLHNLFHFIRLRADKAHAQAEIVVYAKALLELAAIIAPVACEAFKELVFKP